MDSTFRSNVSADVILIEQLKKLCMVFNKMQKMAHQNDSKLRKREEHSNSVHPVPDATTTVVLQTTAVHPSTTVQTATNGTAPQVATAQPQRTETNDPLAYRGQFLWAFPPQPADRMLYNNEQKNIVQTTNNDRPGFVRGFRKNLGGRWRRLVKKKPPTEIYTIPAELKPQLKQIYVY